MDCRKIQRNLEELRISSLQKEMGEGQWEGTKWDKETQNRFNLV